VHKINYFHLNNTLRNKTKAQAQKPITEAVLKQFTRHITNA